MFKCLHTRPNTLCQYTSPHYITSQYTLSVHLSLHLYISSQYIMSVHLSLHHYITSQYTVSTPLHITLRLNTICQHLHLSLHHYITSQYTLSVHLFTLHYVPIHSVSTPLPTPLHYIPIHSVSTPLHITLRPNTLCQYTSPYTITLRPNTFCQYTSPHYITSQYTLSAPTPLPTPLHYDPVQSVSPLFFFFLITFSISMYIMCVCLFSALSRRVGALQISIIIIITRFYQYNNYDDPLRQYTS